MKLYVLKKVGFDDKSFDGRSREKLIGIFDEELKARNVSDACLMSGTYKALNQIWPQFKIEEFELNEVKAEEW